MQKPSPQPRMSPTLLAIAFPRDRCRRSGRCCGGTVYGKSSDCRLGALWFVFAWGYGEAHIRCELRAASTRYEFDVMP